MMLYKFDMYGLAKKILHKDLDPKSSVAEILKVCNEIYPNAFWEACKNLPFDADIQHINTYLTRAFTHPRLAPSTKIEVIWLGLLDVSGGFTVRGSSEWSKDPEDWEWCGSDDYEFNEDDPVPFMSGCLTDVMDAWTERLADMDDPDEMLVKVAGSFATLVYAGAVGQYFFKTAPSEVVLGARKERWFAVGHPDSEYGIILGRRTLKGWETFSE